LVAAAIVIAGVLISTSLLVAIGRPTETLTSTSTEVQPSTITATATTTYTTTQTTTLMSTTTFTVTQTVRTTSQNASNVGYALSFPISINYTGSWALVYWVKDYFGTPPTLEDVVLGNLTGSGDYQTTTTIYVQTPQGRTVCADATKLGASQESLMLSVLVSYNSTTASNPMAEACATLAV